MGDVNMKEADPARSWDAVEDVERAKQEVRNPNGARSSVMSFWSLTSVLT